MKTSDEGLRFIQRWEGCRLDAYQCSAGVWTVGYGHTKDVTEGMRISRPMADAMLLADVHQVERVLGPFVRVPLQPNQWDALVSLAFNVGAPRIAKSMLLRLVNVQDFARWNEKGEVVGGAARHFLDWRNVQGKPDAGVLRRRQAEMELFTRNLKGRTT